MSPCLKGGLHLHRVSLWKPFFLASNFFTALIVYFTFFFYTNVQVHQQLVRKSLALYTPPSSSSPSSPPPPALVQQQPSATVVYIYHFTENNHVILPPLPKSDSGIPFCRENSTELTNETNSLQKGTFTKSEAGNKEVKVTSDTSTNQSRNLSKESTSNIDDEYVPYVIAITPTYYRVTQKSDLTFLCQTLMNIPRLLWIVIEDATNTSKQVKDILGRCRVESVLMNVHTTNESKLYVHRGMEQRNVAMDWIRRRCDECRGRHGLCEGVVYFVDDDNKYDIRLFEMIRPTRGLSIFPVGLVAGLRFEGPVCKDGKVVKWVVQYAPNRHIPVDMAGFALNVKILINKPKVKMGFKYNQSDKPSTKGHAEPDFLHNLGVTKDMAECRGLPDEILVWHVKSSYRALVYEKKNPSDPNVRV